MPHRYVGAAVARPEGAAKVDGSARYVADLDVAGAWLGGTVRSGEPAGRFVGLEIAAGFDLGGVVLVTAADIPGDNVVALLRDDQPLLVAEGGEVRHHGEPLALIAAPSRELLAAALQAIRGRIEPRSPELDMDQATTVLHELNLARGDVDGVLAGAARVVDGVYRTGSQEQMYIEPQGCVAWPEAAGELRVVGSLQCPYYVHKALVRAFAIAPQRARVIQAATGGGFGGKEDYPSVVACHAALLARAAGRPVRLIYDRHEDLAVTPKRHPSRVRHRTAVAADGTLLAMDIDVLLDGGAYTTLSPVVLSRALLHATGPYRCEHVRIRGRVVRTNVPPYGAFRGFGAPQTCFAVERQMDRIARSLGLDPVALRRRNMLRAGDATATGQVLRDSVGSEAVMARICAATGVDRRRPTPAAGRIRRGVGFAFFFHGAGFTGSGEVQLQSRVEVRLRADGRAAVHAASTEIGQGTGAMFTAIAAEALGADAADIVLVEPDTALVPDSGPTVASRTCMVVGGCIARAGAELRARLAAAGAGGGFRDRVQRFLAAGGDGVARITYQSPPGLAWDEASYRGDAYPVFAWAADVVRVAVDLDTFQVTVEDFVTCADVGRAIQPLLVRGQLEGGSLQALGFGHLEVVTTEHGRFRQDRMATCIVPTAGDAPPMTVHLVEEPFAWGPFGAKGIGELPMDGGAPALAAAIDDALGIAVDAVPATPERLLAAWLAAHPDEALPPAAGGRR